LCIAYFVIRYSSLAIRHLKGAADNFPIGHGSFVIKMDNDFHPLETPVFPIAHQRFADDETAAIGSAQFVIQVNARGQNFATAIASRRNYMCRTRILLRYAKKICQFFKKCHTIPVKFFYVFRTYKNS